jgi:hypothetical protein
VERADWSRDSQETRSAWYSIADAIADYVAKPRGAFIPNGVTSFVIFSFSASSGTLANFMPPCQSMKMVAAHCSHYEILPKFQAKAHIDAMQCPHGCGYLLC